MQAPPPLIQPCDASGPLFQHLEKEAARNPRVALECTQALLTAAQRDHILRIAFQSAAARDREAAVRFLPEVAGKPWLGAIGFGNALALVSAAPRYARQLLLAAAERQPTSAIRDLARYSGFSGAREVFERGVALAPQEAASVASGTSGEARAILEALRTSPDPALRELAAIATDRSIDEPSRPRVAVFYRRIATGGISRAQAVKLARSTAGWFAAVAALRLDAAPREARALDAALETEALSLVRTYRDERRFPELKSFSARDLYLVLAYGRAEDDDETFAELFDKVWFPAARRAGVRKVIESARSLRMRAFLASLIAHHRLEPFLEAAGDAILADSIRDLDLDQALVAADILESLAEDRLAEPARAIADAYASAASVESRAIYGLLAARMARRSNEIPPLAARFLPYLRETRTLDTAALFDPQGRSVQRHFFYDDDDGVESFESFRAAYRSDPAWNWEGRGGIVRVMGRGAGGRGIEIWANVPIDLGIVQNRGRAAESDDRREAVARAIAAGGLEPAVYVHRGHAFHVDRTLRTLNGSARFVYLGSCGGTTKVGAVVSLCPNAQVIATRGIGATGVNDALLKAFNDELLRGEPQLEWRSFWERMRARLGGDRHWVDYIAPDRDGAAIFLRAYQEYLLNASE